MLFVTKTVPILFNVLIVLHVFRLLALSPEHLWNTQLLISYFYGNSSTNQTVFYQHSSLTNYSKSTFKFKQLSRRIKVLKIVCGRFGERRIKAIKRNDVIESSILFAMPAAVVN